MKSIGSEAKFLKSLKSGRTISRAQAAVWFKLANPSAAIGRFVEAGVKVKRTYTIKDNVRKVKYSIK